MKKEIRLVKAVIAICFMVVLPVGAVWATPIGGSATLGFDNGGTLSGFFNFNPVADTITSWHLTSTAFGTGSASHVYDSTNTAAGASSGVFSSPAILNPNNEQAFSFFQNFTTGLFELDIVINCLGTANCATLGAQNMAFSVIGGQITCLGSGKPCISSSEQPVVGLGIHFLNAGVLNVTDPPAILAFNVDSTIAPGFTPFAGPRSVPEPATLALFSAGLAGLGALRRRRKPKT